MATNESGQATLAQQSAIALRREQSAIYSNSNSIASLYKRDQSNQFVLREEYLHAAMTMLVPDFETAGLKLPLPIRVSLSAPSAKRKLADDKKPASYENSKLWGNLVHVYKNVNGEYEIYIANQIDAQGTLAVLSALCGALVLTVVGPTQHTDEDKKKKFPNGELTFKSEAYDAAAQTLGILGKYRGNLVTSMTPSLLGILGKVQAALGPCPINRIDVDVAMKSGLKQESTSLKAVCKNANCSALKIKDSKGDSKPFAIANISAYWVKQIEASQSHINCPMCNHPLAFVDTKAEKEQAAAEKARKLLAEQEAAKKAGSNVITLSAPTAPEPEAPAQTPSVAPAIEQAPNANEAPAKMPKTNRQGKNR